MSETEQDILNDRERLFQQKYIYQIQTVESLTRFNMVLTTAYYVFIVIALYFLFTKYDYSIYTKAGISLLAIAYPFIAYMIESIVYRISTYTSAIILGEPADRDMADEKQRQTRVDAEYVKRIQLNSPSNV